DFIYKDNYKDNLENYLEQTGQIAKNSNTPDQELGERERESQHGSYVKLTSNPETSGRYHTDWLNMMYPRLKLARNLLTDDGVIFISIDDNELENLKKICNEIFGDENYVGDFIWQKQGNDNKSIFSSVKTFRNDHEFIVVYAKNDLNLSFERPEEKAVFKNDYGNVDNDSRGNWMSAELGKSDARSLPNGKNYYTLTAPNGVQWTRQWHFNEKEMKELINDNKVYFGRDGNSVPRLKKFISEKTKKIPSSLLVNQGSTKIGQSDFDDFFNGKRHFDYPKPSILIEYFIKLIKNNNFMILDFFSGSATTSQATMKLNSEDNGNRKFIMVQVPETTDEKSETFKTGYKTITEIGKERIRRAGDKIKSESNNNELDIGFKVFKLDSSNLNKWNPDYDDVQQTLLDSVDNVISGRTELDLVYEIMIKYGIDLTLAIEEYNCGEWTVYSVGYGALLVCLDNNVTKQIADFIIKLNNKLDPITLRVVFKDNGFVSDSDKTNIKETLKINNIDEFITI
ncbi:MAG: site-specific DNA-methyltransferase, partial [Methanobrevibacter sp.]|nr:site-specific DNA-methyltransferase [Candidatus Methanoflexus mossambicus]